MSQTTTNTRQRVEDLQSYIREGRVLEAFDEFYADDVAMQENSEEPMHGHAANREREIAFLAMVKEWKSYDVQAIAVEGDVAFVECSMEFIGQDGNDVRMEQVSRTRWRDGKIVSERFLHG